MKITPQTIEVLNNFANINPNLLLKNSNEIRTIDAHKSIVGVATIEEPWPEAADGKGIYDLKEFLSVYSLIDDPDTEFSDKHITIKNNRQRMTYYLAAPGIANKSYPHSDFNKFVNGLPQTDLSFKLTADMINHIRKVAGTIDVDHFQFSNINNKSQIVICDHGGSRQDSYTIDFPESSLKFVDDYEVTYKIKTLNMMVVDDYDVNIHVYTQENKGESWPVTEFTAANYPIKYVTMPDTGSGPMLWTPLGSDT